MTSTGKPVTDTTATGQGSARWVVLAALSAVQFMLLVGDTAVNIALPELGRALSMSPTGLGWVINAYVLAFGGLLIVGGRIAGRFGLVRAFVVGLCVFGLASVGCALAQQGWQLIAFRGVQGVGAAMIAPAILGLLTVVFTDPAERGRAFAVWGTAATTGGIAGLLLSGVLTGLVSWRAVFVLNLPVVLAAVLVVPRLARAYQQAQPRMRIDLLSALLLTLAVGGAAYALLSVSGQQILSTRVLVGALVAVCAAVGFAAVQRRRQERLVPPGLLRAGRGVAIAVGLLVTGAIFGTFVALTLLIQGRWGYDPVQTALTMAPFGVGSIVGIWLGERAAARYGSPTVLLAACWLATAGALVLVFTPGSESYLLLGAGMALFGFGGSGSMPHIVQLAVRGVGPAEAGMAGSVVNSGQQLGGALGVAVTVALLGAAATDFQAALVGVTVIVALAVVFAAGARREALKKGQA